jgi:predicted dehydrogenase
LSDPRIAIVSATQAGSPVGWGIVGTGEMARQFSQALGQSGEARLVAVASRDPARAAASAAALGAVHGGSYADLLAKPDIDVVYVATPNHRHKADCLAAFAAGKAVLCEKPLGMNAAEAREIAAAAERAGVFCMEGMWTHFIPAVVEADRLLHSGAIGTPRTMIASFGAPVAFDPANRFFSPELGGGALLDRGCYPISLALRFFGTVEAITGSSVAAETGVDASSAAILRFAGGGLALIGTSLAAYQSNDLVLSGPAGRLTLHEPITRPTSLSLDRATAIQTGAKPAGKGVKTMLRDIVRKSRLAGLLRKLVKRTTRHVPYQGNGYVHEIREVHRCLRAGQRQSGVVPLSLSIATMDVIDTLRK